MLLQRVATGCLMILTMTAHGTVRYVDVNSPGPSAPYTNWTTAAANIQDAVDASNPGDQILVTDGIYQTGGRVVYGNSTNRVAITKPITVQSVSGPNTTVIQGYQVPTTTNGDSAVRCVYLTNGAVLAGFTLRLGATRAAGDSIREQSGGGVWSESESVTVSNCVFNGNAAAEYGGGSYGATLNDCVLSNNLSALFGGGTGSGTLNNCILSRNSARFGGAVSYSGLVNCTLIANAAADWGGGAHNAVLNNCTLSGNSTGGAGGGANSSTLYHCTVIGNWSAYLGGGVYSATLVNCSLIGNSATNTGGGAMYATLSNCVVTANSAPGAGGAYSCNLNNCTLTGNSATWAGGAGDCELNNCIVYYNSAADGANVSGGTLNYCCTTPLPVGGVGNVAADPLLADLSHLSVNSPCRGVGGPAFASGGDIDDEPWANPPSIGCDEFSLSAITGPFGVFLKAAYTNVAVGFTANFIGQSTGHARASRWDFGDGTVVSNRPYASHAWATPGEFTVTFSTYNDSNPGGVSAAVVMHVLAQPVHYVAPENLTPVAPFASWATAATNIQQAVDGASLPGALVLVSNGIYATGGRIVSGNITNRLAVTNPVKILSVNGPAVTLIQGNPTNGDQAVRCAWLGADTMLAGFTLTLGASRDAGDGDLDQSGAGIWCETPGATISNCIVTACRATYLGGGVLGGTLINCTLSSNSASAGGGAFASSFDNCALTANYASGSGGGAGSCQAGFSTFVGNAAVENGGGADNCVLFDCALAGNSATNSGGGAVNCSLHNCSLSANSASIGGGAAASALANCTLTANSASSGGGGDSCGFNNCILFYNTAIRGANYWRSTALNFCCTTPLPFVGVGNISAEPQMSDPVHISATSPCRGAGGLAYVNGSDIDAEAWANPPAIGCDEFKTGTATGPLAVCIQATYTNVAAGFRINFTAWITGHATLSRWDFADGTTITNSVYPTHAWLAPGDYPVVLQAFNDSFPGGLAATITVHVVSQPIHYVSPASLTPVPPYSSWATAATNIQQAVDASSTVGAMVLVTNGVFRTLGRAVPDHTNIVAITKPVTVQSVSGPSFTVIDGGAAYRCVYLANAATITGFTLTNGATTADAQTPVEQNGAGVRCETISSTVSNCVLSGNSAWALGGAAYLGALNNCVLSGNASPSMAGGAESAVLNNCVLSNNAADAGGGAHACTLNDCMLNANSGNNGGGAYEAVLNGCALTGNSAGYGAGASLAILNKCTLAANHGSQGGGAVDSTLYNCTLSGNSADTGGGALYCTAYNCAFTTNLANGNGGGAVGGTLGNCTLTHNSAAAGGGADASALNNCILYYNSAADGSNYTASCVFNYCCTAPLPDSGASNLAADPQLASASHISAASPCRNSGSSPFALGVDIDEETWLNPPAIGCDEYHSGSVTGALSVVLVASFTNVSTNFVVNFTAQIDGRCTGSRWDFGDGTSQNNQPYVSHNWAGAGNYPVVLTAYNDTYPSGVSATVIIHVIEPFYYVSTASANPIPPFNSWATAATNIQDAVDAAYAGIGTIFVSNGVYAVGGSVVPGSISNRLAVTRPMIVRSVNGPNVTMIKGYQEPITTNGPTAVRCAYLSDGAVVVGFTLANGATGTDYYGDSRGGGLLCESGNAFVSNCIFLGNGAAFGGGGAYSGTLQNCLFSNNWTHAGDGGGACQAALINCLLCGNSAENGGGAGDCVLTNCTVTGNRAIALADSDGIGGGVYASFMYNCIVYYNWIVVNDQAIYGGVTSEWYGDLLGRFRTHYFCCTTPLPPRGYGSITDEPLFVNAAASDFRLQTNSPCVNAGNNSFTPMGADLDGNARVAGAAIDMGAYELQSPPAPAIHYVDINSTNAISPYTNWATAATTIQDAVDVARGGDEVLVNDGRYNVGGRVVENVLSNRVAVTKTISIRSVNGPDTTVIEGFKVPVVIVGETAIRCVFLTDGATLTGFTLTNGATRQSGSFEFDFESGAGGGVFCHGNSAIVSNCIVVGNVAGGSGGGAYSGVLRNCLLGNNSAPGYNWYSTGGGACVSALYNCVLMGNSSLAGGGAAACSLTNCSLAENLATDHGGGVDGCLLANCILYSNTSPTGDNFLDGSALNYCCTTPLPPDGLGNFTYAPLFSDLAGGNLRLQSNSPCINAGFNAFAPSGSDLDGNPRVAGGTVDVGAYEFQTPASSISYAWLKQFGLPIDGSADFADSDGDGMNNWQEWICGTDPTVSSSVLKMLAPSNSVSGFTVTWNSVSGKNYYLQRATTLSPQASFSSIQSNIVGQTQTTSFMDTTATAAAAYFYRVGVQ
jgi:PKD repeat protein